MRDRDAREAEDGRLGVRGFLGSLRPYFRPYRLRVAALIGAMLVELAFEYAMPLSLKFLIDDGIVPGDSGRVVLILSCLLGFAAAFAIIAVAADYLYALVGTDVLNDIRLRIFRHLQRLPADEHERLRPGDVTARFSGDLTAIESAMVLALPNAVYAVLGLVAGAAVLLVLQWKLALLALGGLPLALVFPKVLAKRTAAAADLLKGEQGSLADTVHENVSGQRVVKAFGLEQEMVRTFQGQLASLRRVGTRANFLAWLMERMPNLSVLAVHLAVLWAGSLLAIRGSISVGALVSFNAILVGLSQSVYSITSTIPETVRAAASFRRIDDVLVRRTEVADVPDVVPLPPLQEAIVLRDVTFAHTSGPPVLSDVNLTITRGAFVALVGASGCGKSTLLNLLLRLHDPTGGTILVDGHDIRGVTRASLRDQFGVVFQDTFLFDTSIRENVRLARLDATDAEIEDACRQAEIHDFVLSLRDGYGTPVGERGGQLSGGQRQRIAIARALLRRSAVLVLDEATSALDPGTEADLNHTPLGGGPRSDGGVGHPPALRHRGGRPHRGAGGRTGRRAGYPCRVAGP